MFGQRSSRTSFVPVALAAASFAFNSPSSAQEGKLPPPSPEASMAEVIPGKMSPEIKRKIAAQSRQTEQLASDLDSSVQSVDYAWEKAELSQMTAEVKKLRVQLKANKPVEEDTIRPLLKRYETLSRFVSADDELHNACDSMRRAAKGEEEADGSDNPMSYYQLSHATRNVIGAIEKEVALLLANSKQGPGEKDLIAWIDERIPERAGALTKVRAMQARLEDPTFRAQDQSALLTETVKPWLKGGATAIVSTLLGWLLIATVRDARRARQEAVQRTKDEKATDRTRQREASRLGDIGRRR